MHIAIAIHRCGPDSDVLGMRLKVHDIYALGSNLRILACALETVCSKTPMNPLRCLERPFSLFAIQNWRQLFKQGLDGFSMLQLHRAGLKPRSRNFCFGCENRWFANAARAIVDQNTGCDWRDPVQVVWINTAPSCNCLRSRVSTQCVVRTLWAPLFVRCSNDSFVSSYWRLLWLAFFSDLHYGFESCRKLNFYLLTQLSWHVDFVLTWCRDCAVSRVRHSWLFGIESWTDYSIWKSLKVDPFGC